MSENINYSLLSYPRFHRKAGISSHRQAFNCYKLPTVEGRTGINFILVLDHEWKSILDVGTSPYSELFTFLSKHNEKSVSVRTYYSL